MAHTFNRTIIIGRLGCDPELKQGPKAEYAHFNLSNSTFRDGQEEVQWHSICTFGKQAHLCHDHLHKGDLCCIEGRIEKKAYMHKGETMYKQTIIAERITFLATKKKPTVDAG